MHLSEKDTVAAPQEYTLYPLQDPATRHLKTAVKAEDQDLIMEVDTAASVTAISEATGGRIWPTQPVPPIHPTDVKLRTYTGEAIPVVGKLMVKGPRRGPSSRCCCRRWTQPVGSSWLARLKLEWKHIFNVQAQESLQDVLQRHDTVFKLELGRIKGVEAKLHINAAA